VLALPFERTEAILEGMIAAFEFFGAVPRHVWWDNPKTVATLILKGRERQIHPRYKALAAHYVFEPQFCLPARGNEKPDAESTVKAVQRRFATPVPRVGDLQELNAFFRIRCQAEWQRVVQALFGPFTIKDRLAEDLAAAAPLPEYRFDPCVVRPAVVVDKYQTVAFDCNRYSVPRRFAFQTVAIKGYVDRVVIVAEGREIAAHKRCLDKHQMILDPLHYLATLGRKAGAFDHAPVFRDWKLPSCFADLRNALEELHGLRAGAHRFIQVLQLLGENPLTRVSQAVEECISAHIISADAVIARTRSLAATDAMTRRPALLLPESPPAAVQVPLPDLSRFDQLLDESPSRDRSNNHDMIQISCDTSEPSPISMFLTGPGST
jgi:hypothetical protein